VIKPERNKTMPTAKLIITLGLLGALAGCSMDETDPYTRQGAWRPNGANDTNLRAMLVNPADLGRGVGDGQGNSQQAEAAIERLRADKVKPLPASGIAQITVSGSSGAAAGGAGAGTGAAGTGAP
jgi:hypothetical protein